MSPRGGSRQESRLPPESLQSMRHPATGSRLRSQAACQSRIPERVEHSRSGLGRHHYFGCLSLTTMKGMKGHEVGIQENGLESVRGEILAQESPAMRLAPSSFPGCASAPLHPALIPDNPKCRPSGQFVWPHFLLPLMGLRNPCRRSRYLRCSALLHCRYKTFPQCHQLLGTEPTKALSSPSNQRPINIGRKSTRSLKIFN